MYKELKAQPYKWKYVIKHGSETLSWKTEDIALHQTVEVSQVYYLLL